MKPVMAAIQLIALCLGIYTMSFNFGELMCHAVPVESRNEYNSPTKTLQIAMVELVSGCVLIGFAMTLTDVTGRKG